MEAGVMDRGLSRLKILIVEDGPEARGLLRLMLEEIGVVEIFEASDGKEAIGFVDCAWPPVDIILCDWNMPSMSGLALLETMRGKGIMIPFLMITGRVDKSSIVEAIGGGADGYLGKPYTPAQLEARLRIMAHRAGAI